MTDANFKKNLTAAEYEAIHIILVQNPSFKKIEGDELSAFYKNFETHYNQTKKMIVPTGQEKSAFGRYWNWLYSSISDSERFLVSYNNTKISYKKSVHFLGCAFGRLLGGVQFGFLAKNPDVEEYREDLLEIVGKIQIILKQINPALKLEYIPRRVLGIYHEDLKNIHSFTSQFALELSR